MWGIFQTVLPLYDGLESLFWSLILATIPKMMATRTDAIPIAGWRYGFPNGTKVVSTSAPSAVRTAAPKMVTMMILLILEPPLVITSGTYQVPCSRSRLSDRR